MNREFGFRVWDQEMKEMIYPDPIGDDLICINSDGSLSYVTSGESIYCDTSNLIFNAMHESSG